MTATPLLRSKAARREHRMRNGEIEQIFRDEAGRVLATLIRLVGDFELAEEALQDAFAAALEYWTVAPANPPPTTTTRPALCAEAIDGARLAAAVSFRKVRLVVMPYSGCAANQAAMASIC